VTVVDRPAVVEAVRRLGLDRLDPGVTFLPGDFLVSPLQGPWDLVWASNVIHALPLADVARLAARAASVLRPGGRLLLRDFFVDESRTRPRRAAVFSVHMLAVGSGGRVHTLGEVRGILEEAGFAGIELHQPPGQSSILEGRRGARRTGD
jgi:SAM-dependent methyltransferase